MYSFKGLSTPFLTTYNLHNEHMGGILPQPHKTLCLDSFVEKNWASMCSTVMYNNIKSESSLQEHLRA